MKFEDLRQVPSKSLIEYDVYFKQLLLYALHLVLIEHMRIEIFIKWLVRPLVREVVPQMKMFPCYSVIIDYAQMLKMKEMEVGYIATEDKESEN